MSSLPISLGFLSCQKETEEESWILPATRGLVTWGGDCSERSEACWSEQGQRHDVHHSRYVTHVSLNMRLHRRVCGPTGHSLSD